MSEVVQVVTTCTIIAYRSRGLYRSERPFPSGTRVAVVRSSNRDGVDYFDMDLPDGFYAYVPASFFKSIPPLVQLAEAAE